jgi:hypothetical protein
MLRCSRCVLPESTPGIRFDKEGVCNYCRSYKKLDYRGEKQLLKLLDSYRRGNSKYDFIVTTSGGRDSTYTLLKLVKDYGMKVLAVNYENPFADPQAKENIRNATEKLGVDIVRFKLKKQIHQKIFKNSVNAWFRHPSPALVPMMCVGCKNLWLPIVRIAKQHDIHCVVSGGNRFEQVSFKKVLLSTAAQEKAETTLIWEIFGLVRQTSRNLSYFKPQLIPSFIRGYLFGNPYALGSRIFRRGVKGIDLFFFVEWNEKEVISRIKSELDWNSPGQSSSSWRFDCRIGHMKDFMYMKTLGMTERDDFYAKMIREGQMTREQALQRIEMENKLHLDYIYELLQEAGIERKPRAVFENQPNLI